MTLASTVPPTARIELLQGQPRLLLHGRPSPAQIFFFNTEMPSGQHYLEPQVRAAARAGVHLYSMVLPWPWNAADPAPLHAEGEATLRRFLDLDPEAYFLPRIHNDAAHLYPRIAAERPEECIHYADGTVAEMESMASQWWLDTLEQGLRRTFAHYEQTALADRIIGYCYGSEWFHHGFWDKGWDFNPQNAARFRQWLRGHYGSDAALRAAWGDPAASLETAAIPPLPTPPAANTPEADAPYPVFHEGPAEQRTLDFYAYSSQIVVDTLDRLSRVIKESTGGRRLSIQFYGYGLEVMGSAAGHAQMMRALETSSIDMFVSPVSYDQRVGGGAAAFMAPIDSVPLHGKLWLVENDMRTAGLDLSAMPAAAIAEERKRQAGSRPETIACLTRDFAAMHAHRCGTWWMDLIAGGAFADPELWQAIEKLRAWYDVESEEPPPPYRPEVAVLLDEPSLRALRFMRHPDQPAGLFRNEVFTQSLYYARRMLMRLGTAVGYYYLEDLLAGRVPPCRVYHFPCAFQLTDTQIAALHARLDEAQALAIWQYAPGYLGPGGGDAERAGRLTGLKLAQRAGRLGSRGHRRLHGLHWGESVALDPRLVVLDDENMAETLGFYRQDGAVSAAWRHMGRHRSVFFGDHALSAAALRPLLIEAGVHLWTRQELILHTDGRYLLLQAEAAGTQAIQLPPGYTAQALGRDDLRRRGDTLFADLETNECLCLKLSGSAAGAEL